MLLKLRLYTARTIFCILVFAITIFALISALVTIKAVLAFDFYTAIGAAFAVYASYKVVEKAHKKLELEEDRFYSTFDFRF